MKQSCFHNVQQLIGSFWVVQKDCYRTDTRLTAYLSSLSLSHFSHNATRLHSGRFAAALILKQRATEYETPQAALRAFSQPSIVQRRPDVANASAHRISSPRFKLPSGES